MSKSKTKKTSLKDNLLFKAANLGGTGLGIYELLSHMGAFKDGGRVRGCGVAKKGFGKVMKRKK
jgi:hypothetical protein